LDEGRLAVEPAPERAPEKVVLEDETARAMRERRARFRRDGEERLLARGLAEARLQERARELCLVERLLRVERLERAELTEGFLHPSGGEVRRTSLLEPHEDRRRLPERRDRLPEGLHLVG